jgi:hypothetical protein
MRGIEKSNVNLDKPRGIATREATAMVRICEHIVTITVLSVPVLDITYI